MTNPIFTLSLVRELRGSPLTVLIAFVLLEGNVQVFELNMFSKS